MTPENWIVLIILLVAIIIFVTDRVRVDIVALGVLVSLVLTGLLNPTEAFSGFASPAVITVWGVFILSGAVFRTGIADWLAARILSIAAGKKNTTSEPRLLSVMMLTAGGMSAFMNNIGAVAILLPAVVSIGRKLRIPPSKLLIPLAFAALLGGNLTLIGTPPNILANSLLQSYGGVEPFKFFDFAPMGILVLAGGMIYMLVLGRWLLPNRTPGGSLEDDYPVREFLGEVLVLPESDLVGKNVTETRLGEQYDVTILNFRSEGTTYSPLSERRIQAGDVLLVEGTAQAILGACQRARLVASEGWDASTWEGAGANNLAYNAHLSEVVLSPRTVHSGQTLREINLRKQYGLSVLAIRRAGVARTTNLGATRVTFGDVLLVQGTPDKINLLRTNPNFLLLEAPPLDIRRIEKAPITGAILLAVLGVVLMGWLDVSIAFLIGALAVVSVGALTMDEAYQAIDWKSVFLIAGMLPLGIAMESTGTARLIADQITGLLGDSGPIVVLGGIFLLTAMLTEVISNAAAAVLMVPIAIDAALGLGVQPQAFVMACVVAASTSFLMPIGHQVNVLIYGPGGYKFGDYARVGIGLNILLLVLAVVALPILWPL